MVVRPFYPQGNKERDKTEINVWLERLGSDETRASYGRWLNRFLEFTGATAEETLAWKIEKIEDEMLAFKTNLTKAGLAGNSIIQAWTALKRWFDDNRLKIGVKLKDVDTSRTYLDYIPVKDDIRRLLYKCSLRYKVAASLIAFSGLRPIDVLNLQYQNIKASYERNDTILTITLKQRKTKQWYFTFLGPQGVTYLRDLLEDRRKKGEVFTDETYIVSKDGSKMNEITMKKGLKHAIIRSVGRHPTGEPFRFFRSYGLRKYFRFTTRKLGEDTAEFLMGHVKGQKSLTAIYAGLRDLDPRAIDEIKKEYAKILPDLETELSEESISSELETLRRRVAEMERFNKTFMNLEPSDIDRLMKHAEKPLRSEEARPPSEGVVAYRAAPKQRIILEEELEAHINNGWIFKAALNNGSGKMIVEMAGA